MHCICIGMTFRYLRCEHFESWTSFSLCQAFKYYNNCMLITHISLIWTDILKSQNSWNFWTNLTFSSSWRRSCWPKWDAEKWSFSWKICSQCCSCSTRQNFFDKPGLYTVQIPGRFIFLNFPQKILLNGEQFHPNSTKHLPWPSPNQVKSSQILPWYCLKHGFLF